MPIPVFRTMHADIDFLRRSNEFIGQSRRAAGAEDYACLAKGTVDFLVPPACVPEFGDVAPRGIELTDNVIESSLGVAIALRQLKKEPVRAWCSRKLMKSRAPSRGLQRAIRLGTSKLEHVFTEIETLRARADAVEKRR
jgi:hypothetical protein